MSWFDHLTNFAVGFAGGFNRESSRPPQGGCASARQSPFQSHMAGIGNALGIPMQSTRETNASFQIPFEGRTYLCVAVHGSGKVCIAVYSRIEFRGGDMPSDVRQLVAGVNDQIAEYDLDVLDDDEYSLVVVRAVIPAGDLTVQAFKYGVEQMLIIMSKMDAWLIRNGYAR